MRIKNQFLISIVTFSIILIIIGATISLTQQQITVLNNQGVIAEDIQTGATDLNYISNNYFLYQDNSSISLWQTKFSTLSQELSQLDSTNPQQQTLVDTVSRDMENLNSVFAGVTSFLANAPRNVSIRVLPSFQTQWNRMAVQIQSLAFDSQQLSQAISDQTSQANMTNTILTVAFLGLFGAYFITSYLITYRRTLKSISKLQDGIGVIGSGNLDYIIDANKKDEIADISKSVNQMAINLKTVTASKTELEQAQASLHESEQRWATTLASVGDAVIATDLSGKVVFMNGVAEELTGWSLSEASQKPVKEIFNILNEQTRIVVEDPVSKVLEKGFVVGLANHTVLIRKNKTEVAIDDSGAPIKDKEGKTTGVVLIFRDITESKKAEQALSESEAQLRAYVTTTSDAVYRMNPDWSEMRQLHGQDFIPDTERPDRSWMEKYIHPGDRQHVMEVIKRAIETTSIFELEHRVIRVDGSLGWTFSRAIPLLDKDGKIVEWFGTAKDVTERKKAEKSIQKQAALIDLSPDAIIVKDLDDIIKFWSIGAEKLYGYMRAEAVGRNTRILLRTKFPEQVEKIVSQLERDGNWSGELMHRTKAGQEVIVQSWWLMKTNENGEGEIFESNVDITERRMLQEKLEESAVRLEEYATQMEELANQRLEKLKNAERLAAIGATAGMVGHDIRNPLQAITSDIFLAKTDLASTPESEEKKNIQESLDEIEKNVDYINKIVADLQDYARPLSPKLEEINLEQTVHSVLANINIPGNVTVKHSIRREFPKLKLDQSYIQRILTNLSNNAIQAMPKGGKLTISAVTKNGKAIISVEDTGEGIPEGFRNKLFTPLATTKSKGQGFGLSVVKRLTEGMGGTVTFESEVGKGTKFTIELPI